MRGIKLAGQVVCIYFFYRAGIFIQQVFHMPIPGSIIGMFLLLALLMTGLLKDRFLLEGANFLLLFLPLFFVPATVGVINHFSFFSSRSGILLLTALFMSTLLIMVSSGIAGQKAVEFADKKTRDEKRGL